MPVLASQISSLSALGPLIDVKLTPNMAVVESLNAADKPLPEAVTVTAMIDTGSTGTVVKAGLARQLSLFPVGAHHINTPSSQNVLCHEYFLGVAFQPTAGSRGHAYFEMTAVEAPLEGQHIQCLLGRDFLSLGVLVYTGPTNSFTFSF